MRPEDIPEDEQQMLKEIAEKDGVQIVQLSCHTDEGVMAIPTGKKGKGQAGDKNLPSDL